MLHFAQPPADPDYRLSAVVRRSMLTLKTSVAAAILAGTAAAIGRRDLHRDQSDMQANVTVNCPHHPPAAAAASQADLPCRSANVPPDIRGKQW